jgi:Ca2+-binding RTX toxin-like protein
MSKARWSLFADMAEHSVLAYGDPDSAKAGLNSAYYVYVTMQGYRANLVFLNQEVVPVVSAMLVTLSASGERMTIAFKGTSGFADAGSILVDLKFAAEVALHGYSETLLAYAGQFVDDVKGLIATFPGVTQIVFTGHSLGGMVAEQFTQWFYDPTDPHGFSSAGRDIVGVSIGSPGIMDVSWAPAGKFFHITRAEDVIGMYAGEDHIGPTFTIQDTESDSSLFPGTLEHSKERYAEQIREIYASPLSTHLFENQTVLFLPNFGSNDITSETRYGAVFGGESSDTIRANPAGALWADGEDGRDTLYGGNHGDILSGGAGDDILVGKGGVDRLIGGPGGDQYLIRLFENYDIVSDMGLSGNSDLIAVAAGAIFDKIKFDWFSVEGNDLLIRARAPDDSLAIDIRVVDMGSRSGSIELFDLYTADFGTRLDSWDLAQLWINLGQPAPLADKDPTPPPQSNIFTSGDDSIIRGNGDDNLTTRGEGNDSVDLGGGDDLLVIDYSWTNASVYASQYFSSYRYGAPGIGDGYAYNIERVYVTGGSAADNVQGLGGDDALVGGPGDDTLLGLAGNDSLLGGAGNDVLVGGSGFDWFDGGSGNDYAEVILSDETRAVTFVGGSAASASGFTLVDGTHIRNVERVYLITGSGDDAIWIQGSDQFVYTASGDDELRVAALLGGGNHWEAGAGNDRLIADLSAMSGDVTLSSHPAGFNGVYGYHYPSGGRLHSGPGSYNGYTTVYATQIDFQDMESFEVAGGSGNDSLQAVEGDDVLIGNGGDDLLQGQGGDDRLDGGAGSDQLDAGSGVDWLDGGEGDDIAVIDRSTESRSVSFSTAAAASAAGQTLVDGTHVRNVEHVILITGSGNDRISIRGGEQNITTGSGNDELRVAALLGGNYWEAGTGDDRLIADLSAVSSDVTLSSHPAGFNGVYGYHYPSGGRLHSGTGSYNGYTTVYATQIDFQNMESFNVTGGSGNDNLQAVEGNDVLTGNGGNDHLQGQGGDDRLDGGTGNDQLDAGRGLDWLDGGAGDDLAIVDRATETRSVSFSTVAAASTTGHTLVDGTHVRNVERVSLTTGSGNDVIWLSGNGHYVDTRSGNDTLHLTSLAGQSGWTAGARDGVDIDDHLIADLSAMTSAVTLAVYPGGPFWGYDGSLASGADKLSFYYVDRFTVAGGSGADQLQGLDAADVLTGNGGNDYLQGQGGDDRLDGGAGDDDLSPGSGMDFVDGGAGVDAVNIDRSGETRLVNFSTAAAASAAGQTLVDGTHVRNVERVSLTTGSGNDVIWLSGNGHYVDTRSGNDTLHLTSLAGQSGWTAGARDGVDIDDHLIADLSAMTSAVTLAVYPGGPFWGYDGSLASGADKLSFYYVDRFTVAGGSGADQLQGLDAADVLTGNGGNDYLQGLGGDDRLDGGEGLDSMRGGAGHDTYYVDNIADAVEEVAGEGVDEVRTSVSAYILPANVERLVYTGAGPGSLRGNASDNIITGGASSDIFQLQDGGEDTAIGGSGNDGFLFGAALSAGDVVDGGAGSGDQLGLQGNYGSFGAGGAAFTLGAAHLAGIEVLILLSGSDARFGDTAGNLYSYNLATLDVNVAAGQQLVVSFNTLRAGENVTFDGSAETDGSFMTYGGLGTDILTGGQQSDGFYFGADGRFGSGDRVDGRGGSLDQLGLQGDYSGAGAISFGANSMANIEMLVLLGAGDNRFGGGSGDGFSYDIIMHDSNVAAGATMYISANTLRTDATLTETLDFDGSAETDGFFIVYAGTGTDTIVGGQGADEIWGRGGSDRITGGLGSDILRGGEGDDVFVYNAVAESGPGSRDSILDFTSGSDRLDLTGIDADSLAGGDQAFSFIGSNAFSGSGAGSAGQLRAYWDSASGAWIVEADVNGDGTGDFQISLVLAPSDSLVASDFLL